MRRAARQARSGASSKAAGAPKNAIMAVAGKVLDGAALLLDRDVQKVRDTLH
jgi:hypothetical protein